MNKNRFGLAALGVMTVLALTPAAGQAQQSGEGTDVATAHKHRPVELYVENGNWLDVDVYAVRGLSEIRIGTVRSQERRLFQIPNWATDAGQQIELLAHPVGSNESLSSGIVMINPGDILDWQLSNALSQSSLSVRST